MGKICKTYALFLTLIIATSCLTLLIVKPAVAQTITKPSVPQFSLKYVNGSVEVTIVNQLFAPSAVEGHELRLYYDIRWKEHSLTDWNYLYPLSLLFEASNSVVGKVGDTSVTIISYGLNANNGDNAQLNGDFAGKQIDFQVQALIGYYVLFTTQANERYHYPFHGESSGYSNTQTITIGENQIPEMSSPLSIIFIIATLTATMVYFKKRKH
jgi:hypothetical protein